MSIYNSVYGFFTFGGVVGFYDDKICLKINQLKIKMKRFYFVLPFKAYVLNSSTHSEEDIYNELPICEYRTDETSSTNNEYYTLTFTLFLNIKDYT